ncbi:MAG: aldo/keto reductase [Alphaproteobacteria bacterium]|nr:MAG: aldo/keto reductase [Alphaproteobacteria bacterium]
MRTRTLGHTGIEVTEICLGTMTWGSIQNTEADARAQMDYAFEQGVTFWDTAELYPVNPTNAETYTLTEQYVGRWLKDSGKRDQIVLASKVAGPGRPHIRNGEGLTAAGIKEALEGSLKRLHTDHIDLYQLHWPQRGSYHFGQNWHYAGPGSAIKAQTTSNVVDNMHQTLDVLSGFVKEGKIRAVGLSNESAWGTLKFMQLAKDYNLPRVASVQNEMSLMYRLNDLDMAEVCLRENVSLLPYSPLAAGWLTGKYYGGARPKDSRFALPSYASSQRLTTQAQKAADAYVDLAKKHGLDPAQMAIAWTLTQPFVTSTIIGATTVEQLKTNIAAKDVVLSREVMQGIHEIRQLYPMPY